MATYTTSDKVTGEIVDVAEATNVAAARAAAAALRFEVKLSSSQEILNWGKEGKDISAPRTRKKKEPFVDPAQTDLVKKIEGAAAEPAGESGDIGVASFDEAEISSEEAPAAEA